MDAHAEQTTHQIEGMAFIVRVTPMSSGGWLWTAKGDDGMTDWITGDIFPSAESARCAALATLTRRFA